MIRPCLAIILTLFVATAAAAQDTRPNFSGTWKLDVDKSDFGPAPPPESMVLVIEHADPNLKSSSTQKSAQGELTNTRTLTTDGKDNVNKIRTMAGDQDVKSTSTWNGTKLDTMYRLDVQGLTLDVVDSWGLSEDGKILTISRDLKTSQGDFTQKMVFNKQ
jgi:hypothetical protein